MTHAEQFSLARIVAESRAELAQIERITSYEIARLHGQIAAAEQRIADARLAGEREIARLKDEVDESKQRLAVSQEKLSQAEHRLAVARAAS
jgi:hypothetical protein